ncbi:Neurotrophin 1 [Nymphon striatum]|nr:Neurotrophin 1 [Nymphon striatum]
MVEELRTASNKVGLEINLSKTKVMFNRNVEIQPIMTENVALDQVDRYTYLRQLISIHRDWEPEVRRRGALGWQAFGRLNNVWRSKLPLCLKRKTFCPKLYIVTLFLVLAPFIGHVDCQRSPHMIRPQRRQFIASPLLSPIINALHFSDGRRPKPRPAALPNRRKNTRPPRQSFNEQCEFFTKNICLHDPSYPYEEINESLNKNRRLVSAMYAEGIIDSRGMVDGVDPIQELAYTHSHYYGTRRSDNNDIGHRDYSKEGGFICPSEVKYAKPQRAKNQKGQWKTVVNTKDMPQMVRMERCRKPEQPCSYISNHFISQCSQVYTLQRLMVFDEHRGVHIDVFRVPSCCSCHVKGYAVKFPTIQEPSAAGSIIVESSSNFESSLLGNENEDFLGNAVEHSSAFPSTSRPVKNVEPFFGYDKGSHVLASTRRPFNNQESVFNFESEKIPENFISVKYQNGESANQGYHSNAQTDVLPDTSAETNFNNQPSRRPAINEASFHQLQQMIKFNQQQSQKQFQEFPKKPQAEHQVFPELTKKPINSNIPTPRPQAHSPNVQNLNQRPSHLQSEQRPHPQQFVPQDIRPNRPKEVQHHRPQQPQQVQHHRPQQHQQVQHHRPQQPQQVQHHRPQQPHQVQHQRPQLPQQSQQNRPQRQNQLINRPQHGFNNQFPSQKRPANYGQQKRIPKRRKRPKKPKRNQRKRPTRQRTRRPISKNRNRQRKRPTIEIPYGNRLNHRPRGVKKINNSPGGHTNVQNNPQSRVSAINSKEKLETAASSLSSVTDNRQENSQRRQNLFDREKNKHTTADYAPPISINFSPSFKSSATSKNSEKTNENKEKVRNIKTTTETPTKYTGKYDEDFKPMTYPANNRITQKNAVDRENILKMRSTTKTPLFITTKKSKKQIPYIIPKVDPDNPNTYNYGYHPIIDYMLNNET